MGWVMPTYRRPEQCKKVIDCLTYTGCSTPGIVVVNGLDDVEAYQSIKLPSGWQMAFMPVNIGVCNAMNWAFKNHPNEPFYGLICDDEYVYTNGWDKKLIEAAGNKGIAHGNDKWQSPRRMHLYVTWGGDLLREIGWWSLPGLWHWYHDNVFEQLMAGLPAVKYCENVVGEHKHYLANKAKKDVTYATGESRAKQDQLVYQTWAFREYPVLRKKLEAFYGVNQ